MKFQTQIPLKQNGSNLIDYHTKTLLLGSCFVENIGSKLDYFKFQSTINPFGILFHPKGIEGLIDSALEKKQFTSSNVFFHQEKWHCFLAHSKFSNVSKEGLLRDLNSAIQLTNQNIKEASHIVITLGTSWVYEHVASNCIVANCHKLPQNQFKKQLLSVEEVLTSIENVISKIRKVNIEASIIFTVSPVRHIKDGFTENMQSKAHLLTAIHKVVNVKEEVHYFPSYEIMMDELRDYRFYKEDMLHPNNIAINYIWERFKYVWVSGESNQIMDDVDAVQKDLLHKPFNENSEAHQQFVLKLKEKQRLLQSQFPHMRF